MGKGEIASNFFFSHSVFKRLVSQGRQKVSLCGNGLTRLQLSIFDDNFIVTEIVQIYSIR